MTISQLRRKQLIKAPKEKIWEFISSPKNLKIITPDYMGFDISSNDLAEKMYPGMIISYKVSPFLGLKMNWVTEITHVDEDNFFVDEQRVGPYKLWHHQHHLKETEKGVEMTDIVSYKAPYGFIGSLMTKLIIRRKLDKIFDYRTKKIDELFNS